MKPWATVAARTAVILGLAGCAGSGEAPSEEAPATAAEPQVVEITTSDYAFTAPDSIAAGWVTLRMTAGMGEFHHVQVVRLDEGHTFDDLAAELAKGEGPPPSWVRLLGGANGADPGATVETSLMIEPGNYALICSIPSADGMPHFMKGMMRPLTVTGTTTGTTVPTADATLTMSDSGFALSGPVAAGMRMIRVENSAAMPHEVLIIKLVDGATAASLTTWLMEGMQGPPPGSGRGGTVALEPGTWNMVHADLTPGNYALVDFIPNPADGRPNAAHGMLLDFTVE
jgi:hypothetical protein